MIRLLVFKLLIRFAVTVPGARSVVEEQARTSQFKKPSKCNLLALKTIHDVSYNES